MVLLKTFWTPIMVYDVKSGCKFVSVYTMAISIFLIALIINMLNGGESTQMYNPLFEINVDELHLYMMFSIVFFAYMIVSSLLMLKGVSEDFRTLLLPWIIGMEIVIISILLWSFWLLYKYYIHIYMICSAILYWIVASVQFYCWLCVHTQYQLIVQKKCPHIQIVI